LLQQHHTRNHQSTQEKQTPRHGIAAWASAFPHVNDRLNHMGRTVTTRPGQAGIGRRRAATAHRATPHQARSTTLRQTHGHERSRASRGVRTRCHDRTHEDPALTSTCGAGSRAPTVGLLPPTTCRSPRGGPDAAPCLPVGWARDTRGARGRHSSEEDARAG